MKKFISAMLVLALAAMLVVIPVSAKTETINLIPSDGTYEFVDGNGATTLTWDGAVATLTSAAGWPSLVYTFAEPITFDPAKTVLNLKFTLVSGGTSFRLSNSAGTQIMLHQFTDASFDAAGDVSAAGTYEVSISFADLKEFAGTAEDAYTGKSDLVLNEDGTYTISSIQIYNVTGEVKVEKLELVVTSDDPVASSEEPSKEDPSTSTSDTGIVALAIFAVLSVAGAAVALKRNAK